MMLYHCEREKERIYVIPSTMNSQTNKTAYFSVQKNMQHLEMKTNEINNCVNKE